MGSLGTMQALKGVVGFLWLQQEQFIGSSVNLCNFQMHGAANFNPNFAASV